MLLTVFRETMRGKTISRTLTNIECADIHLEGRGVDLGSKDGTSSHFRFLQIDGEIQHADLYPSGPEILKVDLEDRIPLDDDSQDFLLLFSVLEHLQRPLLVHQRQGKPG